MSERREIPFGRPWIDDRDRAAVLEVLGGNVLTHGPQCKAFEAEFSAFLGPGAHSVTVSSAMAALHLSYLHLGLGPGDEVLTPALTHVATVHAVEWVGARPVCVDADPATGNVDVDALEAAIGPRTRAISVVHFLGIPCAMDRIVAIARKHDLKLVEDCAIALGARFDGVHVGLFGDMGCFSFYPVKHITTGEGGMFISRHADVVEKVAKLRAFGVDRKHDERTIPGMYEVPSLGLNYRMSEMQAALGRTQMAKIAQNLDERRANFEALKQGLANAPNVRVLDSTSPRASQSHYCMSVVLDDRIGARRNEIVRKLNAAGVGTSVYYPQPVPRMQYYRDKYGYDGARFPEATRVSDQSIALPVGHHVSLEDVDYIARTLRRILEEESTR